jgi:hypothetical protein
MPKPKKEEVDLYVFESFIVEYREHRATASGGKAPRASLGSSMAAAGGWRDDAGVATAFLLDNRRSPVRTCTRVARGTAVRRSRACLLACAR